MEESSNGSRIGHVTPDFQHSSNNTADNPNISPNWLLDLRDQEVAIAAFKRVRSVFTTNAMKPVIVGGEAFPSGNTTDAEILSIIQQSCSTIYHAAATCAMGKSTDLMAVVDSQARAIGVSGLRVVDASAFPFLPPGHPQATVYALAEKIADAVVNS